MSFLPFKLSLSCLRCVDSLSPVLWKCHFNPLNGPTILGFDMNNDVLLTRMPNNKYIHPVINIKTNKTNRHRLLSIPDTRCGVTTYVNWMRTLGACRIYAFTNTWWRHQMETFFAWLSICAGNSPVNGEFPAQRPATRSLMFSLICAWLNSWEHSGDADDLRPHRVHQDATVMNHR